MNKAKKNWHLNLFFNVWMFPSCCRHLWWSLYQNIHKYRSWCGRDLNIQMQTCFSDHFDQFTSESKLFQPHWALFDINILYKHEKYSGISTLLKVSISRNNFDKTCSPKCFTANVSHKKEDRKSVIKTRRTNKPNKTKFNSLRSNQTYLIPLW